jgi:hypothetical protein
MSDTEFALSCHQPTSTSLATVGEYGRISHGHRVYCGGDGFLEKGDVSEASKLSCSLMAHRAFTGWTKLDVIVCGFDSR